MIRGRKLIVHALTTVRCKRKFYSEELLPPRQTHPDLSPIHCPLSATTYSENFPLSFNNTPPLPLPSELANVPCRADMRRDERESFSILDQMILIYFANFIVLFFITFTLTPRTNAILIYTELIWKSIFSR